MKFSLWHFMALSVGTIVITCLLIIYSTRMSTLAYFMPQDVTTPREQQEQQPQQPQQQQKPQPILNSNSRHQLQSSPQPSLKQLVDSSSDSFNSNNEENNENNHNNRYYYKQYEYHDFVSNVHNYPFDKNFKDTSFCHLCRQNENTDNSDNNNNNNNDNQAFKMAFQIGFQRSGTTTIEQFLHANKYKVIGVGREKAHGITNNTLDKMSNIMRHNYYTKNAPILTSFCDKMDFLSDYGISVEIDCNSKIHNYTTFHQYSLVHFNKIKWFEIIDSQYYDCSIFILNIRNVNKWLRSRSEFLNKHLNGREYWTVWKNSLNRPISDRTYNNWNKDLTKEEVINYWRQDWYDYICQILHYFDKHPKSSKRKYDLLIYDVENDNPQKICKFLKKYQNPFAKCDAKKFGHAHYTHLDDNGDNAKHNTDQYREIDQIKNICGLQNAHWIK